MVPLGVSAVEPEVSELDDDSVELEDDSVELDDDSVGLEEVSDELDEELEVDGWLDELDEVDELELVTVVSLLQAVRPSAPTRTIEPNATRFRMAVLDMFVSPCWFVTELPLRRRVHPNRFRANPSFRVRAAGCRNDGGDLADIRPARDAESPQNTRVRGPVLRTFGVGQDFLAAVFFAVVFFAAVLRVVAFFAVVFFAVVFFAARLRVVGPFARFSAISS